MRLVIPFRCDHCAGWFGGYVCIDSLDRQLETKTFAMLRFDYRLIAFTATKSPAQRADVLVERRILDGVVAPDGIDDLFTPEQPAAFLAGVLEPVFQDRTRFAGEFNFL